MSSIAKLSFWGIFLLSLQLFSQEFYATRPYSSTNRIYRLDVSNPSEVLEPVCPTTAVLFEDFTDIAIDGASNMYYVTNSGKLYRRNNATSSCEFLGNFDHQINSLVSDSGNYVYATGAFNLLFRYEISTGTITTMGFLPNTHTPGGDLFFFENRLFVTTTTGILEINMLDPSQSCPFMNLSIPNMHAAFALSSELNPSKVYVVSLNFASYPISSSLYEVDMINKQLGNLIRTYPYKFNGAASVYASTSTNSTCTPTPLSVSESTTQNTYFNVINPVIGKITWHTNIENSQISLIQLYDNTGRLIKTFSNQNSLENVDISGTPSGNYLLTITTKKGEIYTKKIIIKS